MSILGPTSEKGGNTRYGGSREGCAECLCMLMEMGKCEIVEFLKGGGT